MNTDNDHIIFKQNKINLNHQKRVQKYHTAKDSELKASTQRRRKIPKLLFGSKTTWSSSITPESGPPSIPNQQHFEANNKREFNLMNQNT